MTSDKRYIVVIMNQLAQRFFLCLQSVCPRFPVICGFYVSVVMLAKLEIYCSSTSI